MRTDCRGWGYTQGIQLGGCAGTQGTEDGGSDQGGRNTVVRSGCILDVFKK